MKRLDALKILELQRILDEARRLSLRASWVTALQACLARNRVALGFRRARDDFERGLRKTVRKVIPRQVRREAAGHVA